MSRQSRFDARYWILGAGALGRPRGMVWEGRREEGSGWGTHVYLWQSHFDIWQNQYNIVKFKNKIKLKKNLLSVFCKNNSLIIIFFFLVSIILFNLFSKFKYLHCSIFLLSIFLANHYRNWRIFVNINTDACSPSL